MLYSTRGRGASFGLGDTPCMFTAVPFTILDAAAASGRVTATRTTTAAPVVVRCILVCGRITDPSMRAIVNNTIITRTKEKRQV